MQPIPLPAPYGGIDEQTPVIALQSPFCERLHNFNITSAGVELRHGDEKYGALATTASPGGYFGIYLAKYGDTKLFAVLYQSLTSIEIWDVDAGAVAYSTAAAGVAAVETLYFNNYLFFFPNAIYTPGVSYDGTVFAAVGYTGTGTFTPFGGNVYNNRAYLIQYNEPAYWYTGISQVTGALTAANDAGKVDLTTIITEKGTLVAIASFTLSDQRDAVAIQSFIFSTGEILFYHGSYPGSETWQLVGRAKIGQPLYYQCGIEYQGDFIAFCDTGVVSLRDLFLTGSEDAASLIVNTRIQETWSAYVAALREHVSTPVGPISTPLAGKLQGVWDPKTDRIIIRFPGMIVEDGSFEARGFYFVFFTRFRSWLTHQTASVGDTQTFAGIVRYKNKIIYMTTLLSATKVLFAEKEGSDGFTDRNGDDTADLGYDYEIISAPVSQGRAYVQRGAGLDVILETDLYAETNYQFIQDFGVTTTTAQTLPTGPTTLQKPFVNMGIEGSYIQYKISGTTTTGKTVGYNLYGVNFWVDAGDSPR